MTAAQSDYMRLSDRRTGGDVWTAYFAGDAVLAPGAAEGRPIGSDVAERVTAADLSVANLAAPLPADGGAAETAGPTRRTALETPALLRGAGFNVATLANDHVTDHGTAGLARTIDACHENSLLTCGAGDDIDDAMAPVYLTVDGTSVAIFDFCERAFGIARGGAAGTAWIGHPDARRRVAEEAERSEVVVVCAHGGTERVPFPSPRRQRQLREFADLGADLVVGHRPRVPQGWEVYEGTPIFYSLGDFLGGDAATRWGLSIAVEFAGATPVAVELVPTVLGDGAVREMARGADRSDRLHRLHRLAGVTADRETLCAHWQTAAVRVFEERYANRLAEGSGDGLLSSVRGPIRRLGGNGDGGADRGSGYDEPSLLLNLLRHESHRDVIETALEVRAGDVEDRRTPEVRSTVEDLRGETAERADGGEASSVGAAIDGLSRRLRRVDPDDGSERERPLTNDAS